MIHCSNLFPSRSGLGCFSLFENDGNTLSEILHNFLNLLLDNETYVVGRNYDGIYLFHLQRFFFNKLGDLGLESADGVVPDPQLFSLPNCNVPIKTISQGAYHSALLTDSGSFNLYRSSSEYMDSCNEGIELNDINQKLSRYNFFSLICEVIM
jgi:hypothetical protein